MAKKVNEYKKEVEKALKAAGKYSKSLGAQILSLAGALRTLDLANDEIDKLEGVTIPVTSRYGNETWAPHPAFKVQKDAQDSVTRQMKALGLTAEELTGTDEDDPLIDLTKKVKNAGRKKASIVKRSGTVEAEASADVDGVEAEASADVDGVEAEASADAEDLSEAGRNVVRQGSETGEI